MIRNFGLFCKLNLIKNPYIILLKDIASMRPGKLACPGCRARHSLSRHDTYQRDFIIIVGGEIKIYSITIPRLICSSCGKTHAYLPAGIVPYSSYGLSFILTVLRLYYLKRYTVTALCEKYCLSISTLYKWIGLFKLHKGLWLDVISNTRTSGITFISYINRKDDFLKLFFLKAGKSFMQTSGFTIRSRRN